MKLFNVRPFIFVLLLFICLPFYSCHRRIAGEAASEDKIAKMQEEKKKEAQKQYELAEKRHMAIQTKETRKRMKRDNKKSARIMAGKPEKTFFQRLFERQPKKSKPKPKKT